MKIAIVIQSSAMQSSAMQSSASGLWRLAIDDRGRCDRAMQWFPIKPIRSAHKIRQQFQPVTLANTASG
ncbi:hypothetical protein ACN4EG_15730 [Alkalinema pantanalense CENA528]